MLKEEVVLLSQLSLSQKETLEKMDKACEEKNADEFNKLRKFFFQIQDKISEISK